MASLERTKIDHRKNLNPPYSLLITMNDFNITDQGEVAGGVFTHISFKNHEQVVFCNDRETGLKAIIGIHSTALGPALGGTRMWHYSSEAEAINDVLRLSRGMTYKAAISGLNLGGGKAVIIADSRKDKTDAMMQKFGEFVNSLSGRYITAEDMGINTHDMEMVKLKTDHVTGIPQSMGGSGDPSPVTAYGVYMGMKAAAKHKYGSENLAGKKVMVQGIGHVGETLVDHLCKEGAEVIINDIHQDRMDEVVTKYGVKAHLGSDIFSVDFDIYAPCALGATVNKNSIPLMNCDIVAGAANNQLADEWQDEILLAQKGILYTPDFVINAGGLINVYSEIAHYDRAQSLQRTEEIFNTTLEIFQDAETNGITNHAAAVKLAQARIDNKKRTVSNYAH